MFVAKTHVDKYFGKQLEFILQYKSDMFAYANSCTRNNVKLIE